MAAVRHPGCQVLQVQLLLLRHRLGVLERRHGRLAVAVAPRVRALGVEVVQPSIQVRLQLLQAGVELLAERDGVELVHQRLVEALADAVGLRALHTRAGVVDVLHRQVELVLVALPRAAVLRAPNGQDPEQAHVLLLEERDDPVVLELGGHQRV